jgi:hypothetical protein
MLLLTLVMATTSGQADDLKGANRILCTSVQATLCELDGECEVGSPWLWNIPQFIEIDLVAKTLGTTQASGERRQTPIKNLEREARQIFLQGVEHGRAFSFAIDEETGMVSAAVASNGRTVAIFGACTPKS